MVKFVHFINLSSSHNIFVNRYSTNLVKKGTKYTHIFKGN